MNNNNNANRPTCKVVTRPGQRGARIHPRGCKVRNRVQGGVVRKESKATGQIKPIKRSVVQRGDEQRVAMRLQGRPNVINFVYDSGAYKTALSAANAIRLGILVNATTPAPGLSFGTDATVVTADGSQGPAKTMRNVPLQIVTTGEVVRGDMLIMPHDDSPPLLGVSHIRHIKSLKVKFRA